MILPALADPPRHYRLEVPATPGWLTLNKRGSWYVWRPVVKQYRQLGYLLALKAGLPRMQRAYVIGELFFVTNRRRDPHNWTPTAKAVLDGMVDAGVFPDDNAHHITGPDMRLGPVRRTCAESIAIHIWPQP